MYPAKLFSSHKTKGFDEAYQEEAPLSELADRCEAEINTAAGVDMPNVDFVTSTKLSPVVDNSFRAAYAYNGQKYNKIMNGAFFIVYAPVDSEPVKVTVDYSVPGALSKGNDLNLSDTFYLYSSNLE